MAAQIKAARAKPRTPARVQLTAYESDQVAQIAAWKSRPPNPVGEILDRITLPGAKLVEKVIPDATVRVAIEQSFRLAVLLAGKEEIKRRAGVHDLSELRKKPLEDCDRLALQTGVFSQVFSTVQGAVTGAGGALTTLIDIPLLFILSLWTILKIGHCYGYPLDQQRDRHFVLGRADRGDFGNDLRREGSGSTSFISSKTCSSRRPNKRFWPKRSCRFSFNSRSSRRFQASEPFPGRS